jgi:hypothetical protein
MNRLTSLQPARSLLLVSFRRLNVPSLRRSLSNVMACPSSAEPDSHQAGLEEYYRLGGNCIHLHGEGGETHSRRAVGKWLRERDVRPDFFLCSQICHEGWDPVGQRAIDRCTPEAVVADIAADLDLAGTDYLSSIRGVTIPAFRLGPSSAFRLCSWSDMAFVFGQDADENE